MPIGKEKAGSAFSPEGFPETAGAFPPEIFSSNTACNSQTASS